MGVKVRGDVSYQPLVMKIYEGSPIHCGIICIHIYEISETVLGQISNIKEIQSRTRESALGTL